MSRARTKRHPPVTAIVAVFAMMAGGLAVMVLGAINGDATVIGLGIGVGTACIVTLFRGWPALPGPPSATSPTGEDTS